MRLSPDKAEFFKKSVKSYLPDASLYLFGSRARADAKGGDIDLLVTGGRELTGQEKRNIKISFYKRFGECKIDLITFKNDDPSAFLQLALTEAIKL
jgi:predicted nucleotidyltransferase